MSNKIIFVTIAILALIVQIVIPTYWFAVGASFFIFWNEWLIEGGIFSANTGTISGFILFLSGIFSVYSIVAFIVPIWSFFLARKLDLNTEWNKKSIVFLIINILTIIIAIGIAISYGIIPHM